MTAVLIDPCFEPVPPRGVYVPQSDSRLLVDALRQEGLAPGRRVVDLCTGSGVVAAAAARLDAARVTAWDICPRAVQYARQNAATENLAIDTFLGPLENAAVSGPYDVVLANPPYVPAPRDTTHEVVYDGSPPLACDAGHDGRRVLDQLCALAPELLSDGGTMLLVQSEFADVARSVRSLEAAGMTARVVMGRRIPFGPVLLARAAWLEATGRLPRGRRDEVLAVIRADKPQ